MNVDPDTYKTAAPDTETLLRNSERITGMFESYIRQFEAKNHTHLADRWKRILVNYQKAVAAKISEQA